jgi:hypothetical protein
MQCGSGVMATGMVGKPRIKISVLRLTRKHSSRDYETKEEKK